MIGKLGLETFHNNVFYLFTKHTAIFKMFRLILNNDYFTNNNLLYSNCSAYYLITAIVIL